MSHSQFHSIDLFILRHAWLNLWDKRMLLAESTRLLSLKQKNRYMSTRKRTLTGTFQMLTENHISWCHFIEEMESPVNDEPVVRRTITHKTYPAKLYFTPETMGDSCSRWIASDSQDRCWLSTNYNPRQTAVGEATLSSISSMTHDLFQEQHPPSDRKLRKRSDQSETGSLLKWLLVSTSIQLLR